MTVDATKLNIGRIAYPRRANPIYHNIWKRSAERFNKSVTQQLHSL
jgi:hypothetical protein